jgi:hypothetical protein
VFEHYRWRWYNKRSAERAAANAWVKDGSDPATAGDRKYDAVRFFRATRPHDEIGDAWQDRYFQPTQLASLERQFWAGGGQSLPPRTPGTGPGMTSGLTAAESAFRAARAALKKQQKGGAADEGVDDASSTPAPSPPQKKPVAKAPAKHASAKKPAKKK